MKFKSVICEQDMTLVIELTPEYVGLVSAGSCTCWCVWNPTIQEVFNSFRRDVKTEPGRRSCVGSQFDSRACSSLCMVQRADSSECY